MRAAKQQPVGDRVVQATWWTLVMGFIGLTGMGAVYAAYSGVADLVASRWSAGTVALLIALTLAGATLVACRHRNDLLYA